MTNNRILSLLKEMKEICEKANPYDDPKKNDKAEALNFAIFLIERMDSCWKIGKPEEKDSVFAKFEGTDKFKSGMFLKRSTDKIVTMEFRGERFTSIAHTCDGIWKNDFLTVHPDAKIIAYADFPKPLKISTE